MARCGEGDGDGHGRLRRGESARYPAIDSVAFDVKAETFRRLAHITVSVVAEESRPGALFFDLPLRLSLALMENSRRDEAARFEPMRPGENRARMSG